MEFAPICVYLVISLLLSLILIGVSFLFASSSSLVEIRKKSQIVAQESRSHHERHHERGLLANIRKTTLLLIEFKPK
jgi:hypothetical protein